MWSSAPGKLRTELLAACAEAPPPPFAQVAVRFDAPKDYFATMARNVKAELCAAVAQALARPGGPKLVHDGGRWRCGETAYETFKNCVVADDDDALLWVSRCTRLGAAAYALSGFDAAGDATALDGRSVRVLVFAADYAARFAAARGGWREAEPDLVAMVLDPGAARDGTFCAPRGGLDDLNASQRGAAEALRRRLEIVHGPPGTGKSTTILGIVRARVPEGRRACVTCVTNQAVDAVASKLDGAGETFVVFGSKDHAGATSRHYLLQALVDGDAAVAEARAALEARGVAPRDVLASLVAALDAAVERATAAILSSTTIFLCTVASLHRLDAAAAYFEGGEALHTVVLDEAGATPETYVPQILSCGAENLVLLGDHNQLPPLVMCSSLDEVVTKRANRSLLERARETADVVHLLNEQYRMPEHVATLVSKLFYGGAIGTAPEKRGAAAPIVWLDVAGSREQGSGTSKYNVGEAAAVVDWLAATAREHPGDSVKVITFYKRQRDVVVRSLPDPGLAAKVVSVDASQGSEADHVLVNTVRSNQLGDLGFCADPRRVCVALSRAKKTLTILGDATTMARAAWTAVLAAAAVAPAPAPDPALLAAVAKAAEEPARCVPATRDAKEKLLPCSFFAKGLCTRGADCPFLHEAPAKAPCQYHYRGACGKGASCPFSHDFRPGDRDVGRLLKRDAPLCEHYARGRCNQGASCPFSHDRKRLTEALKSRPGARR